MWSKKNIVLCQQLLFSLSLGEHVPLLPCSYAFFVILWIKGFIQSPLLRCLIHFCLHWVSMFHKTLFLSEFHQNVNFPGIAKFRKLKGVRDQILWCGYCWVNCVMVLGVYEMWRRTYFQPRWGIAFPKFLRGSFRKEYFTRKIGWHKKEKMLLNWKI